MYTPYTHSTIYNCTEFDRESLVYKSELSSGSSKTIICGQLVLINISHVSCDRS